ncbi:thiamine biosynthesis protein ThiF [Syntrophotalea acetylenivorans]|uniref:Thiamine biosynthesis protein ThiF n=1 Tax=Syntrophotalea acetylenivorans TaxID=1842532 RepID=A0A1L3GPM4_9BACT|nr:sulfur carrier protein ThiS adenylyltransferase ThiF [Syntrophotalea acetylenivorans]APG27889.1 thiamine biosynthesis protein ThiF [Syntrophotalea acetylenivorans]
MQIVLNEQPLEITPDTRLHQLRDRVQPNADVLIRNGHAESGDPLLAEGDILVFIERGRIPTAKELEAQLVARHSPGVHKRLKQATVGIAGLGGLGSPIAVALARSGIGRLILVDFDVVEPSNLNRQQYFVDQLGQPKAHALKDTLARINPYVTVEAHVLRLTPENVSELFSEVDVQVEAFDAAEQKAMLVETFLSQCPGKPLVAGSGMAGFGPSNNIVTRRAAGNLYLVGDGETAAAPGTGLMAPRVGVAAHHQANAVLRLLLGEEP